MSDLKRLRAESDEAAAKALQAEEMEARATYLRAALEKITRSKPSQADEIAEAALAGEAREAGNMRAQVQGSRAEDLESMVVRLRAALEATRRPVNQVLVTWEVGAEIRDLLLEAKREIDWALWGEESKLPQPCDGGICGLPCPTCDASYGKRCEVPDCPGGDRVCTCAPQAPQADVLALRLSQLPDLAHQAILKWGEAQQQEKAVEEMGELLLTLSRFRQGESGHRPGRASAQDVAGEAADVMVTVLQVGLIAVGPFDFADLLLLPRLRAALAEKETGAAP